MVTVAESMETYYPVDNFRAIARKGFVNGNWGNFNRDKLLTSSSAIKPGMGCILATGDDGEDTMTEWAANSSIGYGVAGWDKGQLVTQQTAYTTADLAWIYPFGENRGFIFQGYIDDSTAVLNVNQKMKANATGEFLLQAIGVQYRTYAEMLYYNADTTAGYANVLLMRESNMLGQGTTQV